MTMKTRCRCHGVSGSCEVRTCWKETADITVVGRVLMGMYDWSERINDLVSNDELNRWYGELLKKRRRKIIKNIVSSDAETKMIKRYRKRRRNRKKIAEEQHFTNKTSENNVVETLAEIKDTTESHTKPTIFHLKAENKSEMSQRRIRRHYQSFKLKHTSLYRFMRTSEKKNLDLLSVS